MSPEWLSSRLDQAPGGPDGDVVVADVRWYLDGRSGQDAFATGHLPGAVFVDLAHDLADHANTDPTRGRHPLPTPAAFAEAMARLGIGTDTSVVAYDDSMQGSRLQLAAVAKRLAATGTARNWRTLQALVDLASA